MPNWILVVGYNRYHFEAAQREWFKYNISLHSVKTVPEAIAVFADHPYLAVIASFNLPDMLLLIGKYTELRELTPYALRELVKAIYVEAPDKSSGKRRQRIHICYDLVGFIPLDSLMAQEPA